MKVLLHSKMALVLTNGTIRVDTIDSFDCIGEAKYTHIDAPWAEGFALCDELKIY